MATSAHVLWIYTRTVEERPRARHGRRAPRSPSVQHILISVGLLFSHLRFDGMGIPYCGK